MLTLNGCYSRGRIVKLVCTSCDHVNLHVEMIVVGVVMMVMGVVMMVVLMIVCQNMVVMVICW